ncbi:MAG: PAS domain-containing protein [Burkholderiales bacterium]|nr:PAS domain-containing protein [Burkholderiales bacterium]
MENISAAMNTVNLNSNNKAGAALSAPPVDEPERLSQYPGHLANTYWRSLHYFNFYRMIAAGILLLAHLLLGGRNPFGVLAPNVYVLASVLYLLFCAGVIVTIQTRWPRFDIQLSVQVIADILLITVLMYSSGGIASGLGLLILVTLAASSLISRGRLAMFHAAVATIAVLLQQAYLSFTHTDAGGYLQAGLLSIAYFAIAGLAYVLAKRLTVSEAIAQRQRVDLANLDAVNRLVIQDMQDGVIVVDGDNRVRQLNTQAERLLGPLMGRRGEVPMQEYSRTLSQHIAAWRETGDISVIPLRTPGGKRSFRARITPIGDKRALGAVIFLEDLSRLQAQAQQIKLAALGRLTANIAHEIRNPLSSIGHATQLLQEEESFDATQRRLLEIIRDNTFRLDRMVQDILQLNRKDRGQPETIPLAQFLNTFRQEFSQIEHIEPESIVIESDPALHFNFDRLHLHQILWNLCRNAWRHCQQQPGSIRIVASRADAENVIQLDVIDDGAGVPSAIQAQLFEPFFTTESTGTGLGLYIARQLAEANGATLDHIEIAPGGQFRLSVKGAMS